MTKQIKRPLSILLAVLMIVGVFTTLPITASAADKIPYAVIDDTGTTLTFRYDANMPASNAWDATDTGTSYPDWIQIRSITKVVIDSSFAAARPKSTSHWF